MDIGKAAILKEEQITQYLPKPIQGVIENGDIESMKLINVEHAVEIALANASEGNYKFIDANGRDFDDGTDAKTSTVYSTYSSYRWRRGLTIANVQNKIGGLRIVVVNPFSKKVDFFFIPKEKVDFLATFPMWEKRRDINAAWSEKNGYNKLEPYQVFSFKELAMRRDRDSTLNEEEGVRYSYAA